jgi:hypothetical protein
MLSGRLAASRMATSRATSAYRSPCHPRSRERPPPSRVPNSEISLVLLSQRRVRPGPSQKKLSNAYLLLRAQVPRRSTAKGRRSSTRDGRVWPSPLQAVSSPPSPACHLASADSRMACPRIISDSPELHLNSRVSPRATTIIRYSTRRSTICRAMLVRHRAAPSHTAAPLSSV